MVEPQTDEGRRVEYAPSCGGGVPGGVVSVVLGEDEDVRWCWTHYPDGRSVVTGYEIVRKERAGGAEEFSFEKAVKELLWPAEKDSGGSSIRGRD